MFPDSNRLDSILGKSGAKTKDSYESKLSLASRIVKVERTVSLMMMMMVNNSNRCHQSV